MQATALIQPNKITYARYDFTALQKNIIYYIYESLQHHLTKEKEIRQDLFNNFVVSVPVSSLCSEKNHSKVIESAKDLMTKPFQYDYKQGLKNYTVATVLVHTAKHQHGSNTVELTIPFEALSLLLYIGDGFTIYQKTIAISLKSKHSKRLYEMCCRWKDKGGFTISLDEFKKMLCIDNQYKDINRLKDVVLDIAQKELKESADVWFEYELQKIKSRSYNWLQFKLFSNDPKKAAADRGIYPNVYNFLIITFPNMFSDAALRITDQLHERGQLSLAWDKLRPKYEEYRDDMLSIKHLMNLTKKILREDFNIKI